MADNFSHIPAGVGDPARKASTVTPHATTPLADVARSLWVGGAGNLVVRMVDDDADVTFVAVQAGQLLPIRVSHVRASSTATNIVALR